MLLRPNRLKYNLVRSVRQKNRPSKTTVDDGQVPKERDEERKKVKKMTIDDGRVADQMDEEEHGRQVSRGVNRRRRVEN